MMLWIKAFHLVAVISWFAGLFYLPRLFVYHAQATDALGRERFCLMERKLYFGIMWPAMLLTILLGGWMLALQWDNYRGQGWLHAKLALVALLLIYHGLCGRFLKDFKEQRNRHSHVFFRWFNEVPVILLIGICILVIVRPF